MSTVIAALFIIVSAPPCTTQTTGRSVSRPGSSLPAGSSPISAALGHIASDLEAGRFLEAESKSRALVKSQPNNVLAWTYLGMASVRLGQAQQGIQAYERAIALNPKDTRLYFDVALLYASKNDLGMAIDRYQKGLSLEDRNGTAYYNYGRLLTSQGRFPEAIAALNRAVEINPIDTEARTALVEVLLLAKQRREAADQVRVFLETSRVPARALVSLGALLGRSGEAELAKTVLTRALSISPDSSEAHVELSKVCLALNQYPSAVRAAKRAVELNPASLETNLALAETFISGRRDPEAVELLSKVQSRFEHSAAFQYTLGVAEYRAGRHQPAIAALKKAVQLDPGLDLAHFLLGQISLTAGELEQAEASFKAAVSLRPKSVLYCNYLARVYEQQGSQFHQAAVELTKRALALDPKDVDSKERLAKWAKEEGDLPRARALLEQVVAEAPGQISARVLLASVYYRLNLRKEGDEQQKVIRSLEAEAQKQPRPAN